MRWFKFYPGDWFIGTSGMSAAAKGVYIDMLCMQWHGRRLPADMSELSEMIPAVTERVYRELMQHFAVEDGWLVNRRLLAERSDASHRAEVARRGAAAKHSRSSAGAVPKQCPSSAGAVLEQCYTEAETEPETEQEAETEAEAEPKRRKRRAPDPLRWSMSDGFTGYTDEDLERWRKAYPLVDIKPDIGRCAEHVRSVPSKQATRNWRKMLVGWFARSQRWAVEAQAKAKAGRQRDESHIPDDVHPDDRRLFFSPEGKPREPAIWRKKNGEWCI
jgi:uncharacterized protein YdaU (DUF1376 family)